MSAETDWTAQMDQFLRAMKDVARMARSCYVELVESGFSSQEAMQLVMSWQRDVMAGAQQEDES